MAVAALRPYDIQPGESATAYEAFAVYRDMGAERSMVKAGQVLAKTRGTMDRWAARFNWTARVRAFDEEVARRSTVASVDAHAEAKARHAALGVAMQKWGKAVIDSTPAEEAKAAEAISAIVRGVAVEREASDMPTRVDVTSGGKPISPTVREVLVNKAQRADEGAVDEGE